MDKLQFIALIAQLALEHGASISSWLRTLRHNAAVGGKPKSHHLTGHAADLVLDDHDRAPKLIAAAQKLGLQAFDDKTHVHVQTTAHV